MPENIPPSAPDPVGAPPPPPAAAAYPPVPTGGADPGTTTGLMPNVAAGLACLLTLVTGIIFLVLEKRNRFVRFWAMQATVFGAVWLAANLALWVVGFVFGHIPVINIFVGILLFFVSLALGIAGLILWIIMLVKSFGGQEWDAPFLGKIARQQLAKMDAGAGPLP